MEDHYDVVVVGFGFAGAAAAIAAADRGARVLLLEKMPDPGGISITAGGGMRVCSDTDAAIAYLDASNNGRTPLENIRPIAEGMAWLPEWFRTLSATSGASSQVRSAPGNYPFPGYERLQMLSVTDIPDFAPRDEYPHAKALTGGTREALGGFAPNPAGSGVGVFKVVHEAVQARPSIDVLLGVAAKRVIQRDGAVAALEVEQAAGTRQIRSRGGVVLACGGFESSPEMKEQYWQMAPVLSSACRGNTGDGIRMAQAVGADLWHMWHYHGTYGFRHPTQPDIGIRMKRLPDWRPEGYGVDGDANERAAAMAWILVDQDGRRFMNEYGPYVQDTGQRAMEPFDAAVLANRRVPCWAVFDDEARQLYPVGGPVLNDRDRAVHYDWSTDNLRELDTGLLHRFESIDEMASFMGVSSERLLATVASWNADIDTATPDWLGRPSTSRVRIGTPPYFCGQIWPIVSNTQGGPRHDALQRVVNPFDEPIDGLYVAGELGSIWGHLYTSGLNLTECFVTGKLAGEHAAHRAGCNT